MYKIRYTELAIQDLENLFDNIYKDKPKVAFEYIEKIEVYIELLETNPQMGVNCKNKGLDIDCRVLIYGNYLIFYKLQNNLIKIIRVLNSKIDYKRVVK